MIGLVIPVAFIALALRHSRIPQLGSAGHPGQGGSMTRPAYVRQLAAELELLSFGSVTSWHPGGTSVPGSRAPTGDSSPPHLMFLAEWDVRGDVVLEKWLNVLKGWKGGSRPRPEGKTDREVMLEDGEGHSVKDVADRFRLTPSIVRKWRREAGVNEETGKGESIAAKAKRLRDEGMPVRQIASVVGTHPTQVQRWTGKRAA